MTPAPIKDGASDRDVATMSLAEYRLNGKVEVSGRQQGGQRSRMRMIIMIIVIIEEKREKEGLLEVSNHEN
jgi:hypothetical protein